MAEPKFTLPSEIEIAMTCSFKASRAAVFDALVTPEIVRRWMLGPPGWTMPVCEIEPRVGGVCRFVWRGPDGNEMGLAGTFLEFVRPERTVRTELFDNDWTGGETVVTTALSEAAGEVTVMMTIHYASEDGRDRALNSGMPEGVAAGYRRLEALLAAAPAEKAD